MKTIKLSREDAEKKGIWNSQKHISYILYLDCNNLYGWALSQSLPIGEFLNHNFLWGKFSKTVRENACKLLNNKKLVKLMNELLDSCGDNDKFRKKADELYQSTTFENVINQMFIGNADYRKLKITPSDFTEEMILNLDDNSEYIHGRLGYSS